MTTSPLKVEELEGDLLDLSVALAVDIHGGDIGIRKGHGCSYYNGSGLYHFTPSTSWYHCGQMIDEHGMEFKWVSDATIEAYSHTMNEVRSYGSNHLIAACRLIVASKFGDTVNIPNELLDKSL